MVKRYVYVCLMAMLITSLAFGTEVRKVTQEDIEWGDPSTTVTSAGGHVGHRIDNTYRVAPWWVNVKAAPYSAVGDNTTDDTAAIQAAIDAVNTSGGGIVFFPKGTYSITDSITMRSNVSLHGAGRGSYEGTTAPNRGSMLQWAGGSSGTMIVNLGTWNVTIDGINLNGNLTTDNTSTLVGIATNSISGGAGNSRTVIRNFEIWNCDYALTFSKENVGGNNTDAWIVENFFIYFCNVGIYTDTQNVALSEIRNGNIMVTDVGVWLNRSGQLKISTTWVGPFNWPDRTAGTHRACILLGSLSGLLELTHVGSEGSDPAQDIVMGWKFLKNDIFVNYGHYELYMSHSIPGHPLVFDETQFFTSINNQWFQDNQVTLNGTDSFIRSIGDLYSSLVTSGVVFADNGINNTIITIGSGGASSMTGIEINGVDLSPRAAMAPAILTDDNTITIDMGVVLWFASAGIENSALTLPSIGGDSSTDGKAVTVKLLSAAAGMVVAPNGSDTIYDNTTFALPSQNSAATFLAYNGVWYVTSAYTP